MQRYNVIYCSDPDNGSVLRIACVTKNLAFHDFSKALNEEQRLRTAHILMSLEHNEGRHRYMIIESVPY